MVTCMNKERKYGSVISNGKVSVDCDNPIEYGGDGYVFGPHDFIEAGYAACLDEEVSKGVAQRVYDDCLVKSNLSKELVFEPHGE